jgi:ABC-type multidrug transport system fused ATPase/permease subunit
MDEATASIDMETDTLIQRMVRDRFKNTTVLTIAHRLDTIIDSDKIAVMNDGVLAEFESSSILLKTKTLFNELWTRHKQEEGNK